MTINREKSVAFSGYRASKMLSSIIGDDGIEALSERIDGAIAELFEQGYTTFITGMSDGFDMVAASAVLRLKAKCDGVVLIAAIPFRGQEKGYSKQDKELYAKIIAEADITLYLSYKYISPKQYLCRNDFMVLNSSHLLCFYDGKRGGTMYTYNLARKMGLGITNLAR